MVTLILSSQRLQRRHAMRLVSVVATRCPEPPPRPAPGWVEAPMCQSRPTGVAWRPDDASGLHRKTTVNLFRKLDNQLKVTTGNTVDLKIVLAGGLAV